jgi:hypothetical protein
MVTHTPLWEQLFKSMVIYDSIEIVFGVGVYLHLNSKQRYGTDYTRTGTERSNFHRFVAQN